MPTANNDQREPCTEAQDQLSKTLTEREMLILEDDEPFPLNLSQVQRIQQKELNSKKSKLKQLVNDNKSGYKVSTLDESEIVTYEDKIYVPKQLQKKTMNWYHHFLNHPGGERLYKTLQQVCYWKGMTVQSTNFCKKCETCQLYKSRKRKFGELPPKNVGKLIPWHTVHTDLVGPYSITAKQQQVDNTIKEVELQLTCMTIIDPATGWFEIIEVPNYIIEELNTKSTQDKIDKTSARISQLFNQTWIQRYPRPNKVIFDNGSEFKKDFVPLLKDFAIKPKCTTIKNPQSNSPVERIHQVLRHMFLTKNLKNQVFDYIDPFGELLASVAWAIRASYNSTTNATPAQLVFGRDMIFNLQTMVDWKALSIRKQKLVDAANLRENQNRIDFDYQIGQKVYVINNDIKRKLESPKKGPYLITNIYTNGTVRIQRGNVNERINIRRLEPHFE